MKTYVQQPSGFEIIDDRAPYGKDGSESADNDESKASTEVTLRQVKNKKPRYK